MSVRVSVLVRWRSMTKENEELFQEIIEVLAKHFGATCTFSQVSDKYNESKKITLEYGHSKKNLTEA